MKAFFVLILLVLVHTWPLWDLKTNVAGLHGDSLAHAGIAEWYCKNVVTGNFQTDIFMAPHGVSVAGNYESPIPFILTCPLQGLGSQVQFHVFILLQLLLIVGSAWLVARKFFESRSLGFAYVLFVWWTGYYFSRIDQHSTLLGNIWGFQLALYALASFDVRKWKTCALSGFLLALAYAGTFQNIPNLTLFIAVGFFVQLYSQRKELSVGSVGPGAAGVFSFLIPFLFFWGPMIWFTLKNGPTSVTTQRAFYNFDVFGPFLPIAQNWLNQITNLSREMGFERFNSFDLLVMIVVYVSLFKKEFWQNRKMAGLWILAMIYLVFSWGPEIRLNDVALFNFQFNEWVFKVFPFSVTRTPARLAIVAHLIFVFLAFLILQKRFGKNKYLVPVLLIWIFVTGPLMNQKIFYPVTDYAKLFPMKGIEAIKKLPADQIVVQIPSAWAQDPMQNFARLLHGHRITSAYLAYPVYSDPELREKFLNDPLLGKLGCFGETTVYQESAFLKDFEAVRRQMEQQKLGAIIINKTFLMNYPQCQALNAWVVQLVNQPWIKIIEENNNTLIAIRQ